MEIGKLAKTQKKGAKAVEEDKEIEEDEKLKPTRALSSYIFFANDRVPGIKQTENLTHLKAMSRAGELWNGLSEQEK